MKNGSTIFGTVWMALLLSTYSCNYYESPPCNSPLDLPVYLLEDVASPNVASSMRFLRSRDGIHDTVELVLEQRDTIMVFLDACGDFCSCYGESLVLGYNATNDTLSIVIQHNYRHPEPLGYEAVAISFSGADGKGRDRNFYTRYDPDGSDTGFVYEASSLTGLQFRSHLDSGILFFQVSNKTYQRLP